MSDTELTVGDLKRHLAAWPDSMKLSFAGHLQISRLRRCSDDEVMVEWEEALGWPTEAFNRRNPQVKVIFVATDRSEGSVEVVIE